MMSYSIRNFGHHWFRYWPVTFWHYATTWNNAHLLSTGSLWENLSKISPNHNDSFKHMHLKILSSKCQPFCSGCNVINDDANHHKNVTGKVSSVNESVNLLEFCVERPRVYHAKYEQPHGSNEKQAGQNQYIITTPPIFSKMPTTDTP